MDTFRRYYYLTKPGIIYGNALTAAAGFLLAAHWHIDFPKFFGLLLGSSLVIAAACVINNYLDKGIDSKMQRTRRRAFVRGTIGGRAALIYASLLLLAGFGLLSAYTNTLTVVIGLVALIDYVALYGLTKRRGPYGTLVGSISGAAPIAAGYTAVTDRFDGGALLLFLLMVLWQMPHFYAIALYRYKDYKAAGLPVLPVMKGFRQTKIQIMAYIVTFTAAAACLSIFGYTGYTYLVVMVGTGLLWFWRGLEGFRSNDTRVWGRKMFLFSLIVVLVLSVMTSLGGILP